MTQPNQDLFEDKQPTPKKPAKAMKTVGTSSMAVKVDPPIEPTTRTDMLKILAQAAADPRCQPEKMRALLDMHKEIQAEEARMAFTQAFVEMQAELPMIRQDGRIIVESKGGRQGNKDKGGTPYATFNAINKVLKPILKKHGFVLWFEPGIGADGTGLTVTGHLDHVKGHGTSCTLPLPLETSGFKNNVQGVGSSMSYGKRYCTIALTNILSEAAEDKDDDGQAAGAKVEPSISEQQVTELKNLIDASGVGIPRFTEKYNISSVTALPARLFEAAKSACNEYGKARLAKEAEEEGDA